MRPTPELLRAVEAGEVDLLDLYDRDMQLYAEMELKVQTKSGLQVPFVLNKSQQILDETCERMLKETGRIRLILLKARQFGGSTYIAGRIFRNTSKRHSKHGKVIAHEADPARNLLGMYKNYYNHLAEELRPKTMYRSKEELTFDDPHNPGQGLGSSLGVYSAKTAGAGRSTTVQYLHCSEVAFWERDPEKTMLGLINTVPSSEQEGNGTEIYVESTANGVGNYFYKKYMSAKRREPGEAFWALFIPWYIHDEYRATPPIDFAKNLTPEERALYEEEHEDWDFVNPATERKSLSLEQIAWRRVAIATLCNHDVRKFQQEYPLTDTEAFVTSGENFFDLEAVNKRQVAIGKAKLQPEFIGSLTWGKGRHKKVQGPAQLAEDRFNGPLTIWYKPEAGERYVYFADAGEGINEGDFSVVDIFRRKDGMQVAQWRGRIAPDLLAQVIFDLGRYYNWAMGSPELNNHGLTTFLKLKELNYPSNYRRKTYDKVVTEEREQEGWKTTQVTRPLMLDSFRQAFRDGDVIINSLVTLEEMRTFVKIKGKFQAQEGSFDDCVMTACGACQMLQEIPTHTGKKKKNWVDEPASRKVKSGRPRYNRFTGALE